MNPVAQYHRTLHTLISEARKDLSKSLREAAEAATRDADNVCRGGYSIYDFASMAKDIQQARVRLMTLQDEMRRFSALVVETGPAAQPGNKLEVC